MVTKTFFEPEVSGMLDESFSQLSGHQERKTKRQAARQGRKAQRQTARQDRKMVKVQTKAIKKTGKVDRKNMKVAGRIARKGGGAPGENVNTMTTEGNAPDYGNDNLVKNGYPVKTDGMSTGHSDDNEYGASDQQQSVEQATDQMSDQVQPGQSELNRLSESVMENSDPDSQLYRNAKSIEENTEGDGGGEEGSQEGGEEENFSGADVKKFVSDNSNNLAIVGSLIVGVIALVYICK